MKIRLLFILFFVAGYFGAFSQVIYSSTAEYGNRFNIGPGQAGTPKVAFDDISFPNSLVVGDDSLSVTKVKVGIRRAPGAPATDVKIFYTPLDDSSTQLNTYIKIAPVLLGTVSLPANPSSLVTAIVSVGDSVSTLFKMKPDTSALYPGYRTFFIGASLSNSNPANGLRFTSGPAQNRDIMWIYDADSSVSQFSATSKNLAGNPAATFYIEVFGRIQSILPITLSSFIGEQKDGANVLTWTTESELNNKGFELQRSTDGINFSPISFVDTKAPNGNSASKLTYLYIDRSFMDGNNYYRLRQVDKDGHSNVSAVVLLKGDQLKPLKITNVYPNPVKSTLNAMIVSSASEQINIIITDFMGRILIKQTQKLAKGANNFALNVSALSAGNYTIKVVSENNQASVVYKFMKQ